MRRGANGVKPSVAGTVSLMSSLRRRIPFDPVVGEARRGRIRGARIAARSPASPEVQRPRGPVGDELDLDRPQLEEPLVRDPRPGKVGEGEAIAAVPETTSGDALALEEIVGLDGRGVVPFANPLDHL